MTRFPHDERTAELRQHQQRIELDKLHRQLLRRGGGIADPSLLPVEVLYLEAMNTAESSPETAVTMLQSLIRLYGAGTASADAHDRHAMYVQLAERQLAQLREDVAKLAAREIAAIRERLTAAERLAKEHPEPARDIYRAIIELYGDHPWAAEVVAEARQKLDTLTEINE